MGLSAEVIADLRSEVAPLLLCSGHNAVYVGNGRAVDVVRWLVRRGFVVLGLEGFDCDGQHLYPRADYIADLSAATDGGASTRDAISLLDSWHGQVQWIDIIVTPP